MTLLPRVKYLNKIKSLLNSNPIVALIGPRQAGKTTLAKQIAREYENVTFTRAPSLRVREASGRSNPEM